MRCMQACSTPPTYWSTGANRRIFSGSSGARSFFGSMYRRKYQEDSTKVSNVSVSRRPGFPQEGHGTRSHCSAPASGFPRSRVYGRSSGSTTGRSFSGTGTMPHASQWITGSGNPSTAAG